MFNDNGMTHGCDILKPELPCSKQLTYKITAVPSIYRTTKVNPHQNYFVKL